MEFLIYLLSLIASSLIFMIIIRGSFWRSGKIQQRINQLNQLYEEEVDIEDRRQLPFKDRIIQPFLNKLRELVRRITPEGISNSVNRNYLPQTIPMDFLWLDGWAFALYFPIYFLLCLQFSYGLAPCLLQSKYCGPWCLPLFAIYFLMSC